MAVQNSKVVAYLTHRFFFRPPHLHLHPPTLSSPSLFKKPKMSAEDVFEGAVGIDLGTTYS